MADPGGIPKMMLGFVVRRFVADTGREPSPEEFAAWANRYHDGEREVCLFGRPITTHEARIILRHRGRPVSARGAQAHEAGAEAGAPNAPQPTNVASLAEARARRAVRQSFRR